jgi:DNA-binding XRE family transcriptional regulator
MADITQFQLAKVSGVERTRISLAENGHVTLRTEEYVALNGALLDVLRSRVSDFQGLLLGIEEGAGDAS